MKYALLRWLLVLPISILGGTLANSLGSFVASYQLPYNSNSLYSTFIVPAYISFPGAFITTVLASIIAPRYKYIISIIMCCLFIISETYLLIYVNSGVWVYETTDIINSLFTIIGAFTGCLYIKKNNS
tara:strand:+ start:110 stop:493 length:384 start_codon:yes stop_codon:yes gene_type:complete